MQILKLLLELLENTNFYQSFIWGGKVKNKFGNMQFVTLSYTLVKHTGISSVSNCI